MKFLPTSLRPRPLDSFLGVDIKTGSTIVTYFALFNKVAGVYGLIAVFTGGTVAQLSMYIYSVFTLVVFLYGLRAISQENPRETFYFAHVFAVDHIFSSLWLSFFSVQWWIYTEHDGKQMAHSKAQEEIIKTAVGISVYTDEQRTRMAKELWEKENGFAALIIVVGWLLKLYFGLILYSYALHLRRGTYRSRRESSYGLVPQSATQGAFDLPSHADEFELDDRGIGMYSPATTNLLFQTPNSATSFPADAFRKPPIPNGTGRGDVIFDAGVSRR